MITNRKLRWIIQFAILGGIVPFILNFFLFIFFRNAGGEQASLSYYIPSILTILVTAALGALIGIFTARDVASDNEITSQETSPVKSFNILPVVVFSILAFFEGSFFAQKGLFIFLAFFYGLVAAIISVFLGFAIGKIYKPMRIKSPIEPFLIFLCVLVIFLVMIVKSGSFF